MLKLIVLTMIVLFVLSALAALVVAMVSLAAIVLVIGLPMYFLGRHWMQHKGLSRPRVNPLERLQHLYIEGKIDLFEYEQRVAHILAID